MTPHLRGWRPVWEILDPPLIYVQLVAFAVTDVPCEWGFGSISQTNGFGGKNSQNGFFCKIIFYSLFNFYVSNLCPAHN